MSSTIILAKLGRRVDGPEVPRNLPRYEKMAVLEADPRSRMMIWAILERHITKGKHPNDCWLWEGSTTKWGYGRVNICGDIWLAHRLSFWVHTGLLSRELHVCHHCDNPPCSNPKHLFQGTDLDNHRDKCRKGRHPMGEQTPQHILTEEQVKMIRSEYITYTVSQFFLARKYGVTRSCIEQLLHRVTWAWL